MRAAYVVAATLAAACTKPKAEGAAATDAAAPSASADAARQSELVTGFDAPMTRREAEGFSVTFVEALAQAGNVYLSLSFRSASDEERPISSTISIQASDPSGVTGELDTRQSKCDGMLPPRGRFACVVKYRFPGGIPSELRVRAEGVWFHVRVPKDAGASPAASAR